MRVALALCLIAAPALAQDLTPPPQVDDDGFSLMEEGAKLVLRGLMSEMEPAIGEMEKALTEMGPALDQLGPKLHQLIGMIDDFKNYDAPVMLPNGDILIRRNAPLGPPLAPQPGPNGEIEL
jgi:hypothetical protein